MRFAFLLVWMGLLTASGAVLGEEAGRFFPPGVWGKPAPASNWTQAEQDQFYENWFGERLRSEKEKPLWVHRAMENAALSIRMSIYRGAVTPDFWMIRLAVMPDGRVTYYARDFDGCPVEGKPNVVDLTCMKLVDGKGFVDRVTAERIKLLVQRIGPLTNKTPSQKKDRGLDGTVTVFEFSDGRKFNAIKRWELNSANEGDLARLEEVLREVGRQVWK